MGRSTSDDSIRRGGRSGDLVPCPVVAVGASAGGLDTFEALFAGLAPDTGLAFVLIQHLAPDHSTLIPEILGRSTALPVQLVTAETVVERDRIYVAPPDAVLTIEDGVLKVTRPVGSRRRRPIDRFLRSLAEDQGDEAVGVILSGTGIDGALGLQAIRDHGGLTLVQLPSSTPFDGMPRQAIELGVAQHVLPVEQMPAVLAEHAARRVQAAHAAADLAGEIAGQLGPITALLRRGTGHDFRRYKHSTLVRRVRRRIQALRLESAAAYVARLGEDGGEIRHLFRDLLIGVTHFFRDPAAFDELAARVVPALFEGMGSDGHVRVWVPGCATGEEAYTLAILLREHAERLPTPPRLQIFATDIDEPALETARRGWYTPGIAEQLTPERLERWFVRHGNLYQVAREVREVCLFSTHDLIADPPFSRLDLISCRNLLIYLEADLQKRVIPLFHYALNRGGYLFLGPAESIASRSDLFRTVAKRHRLFQAKSTALRPAVSFPLSERRRAVLRRPWDLPAQAVGAGDQVLQRPSDGATVEAPDDGDPRVRQLEDELRTTRADLQAAVDELEGSTEELVSSNEELLSINEELQAANEELQTSKEELREASRRKDEFLALLGHELRNPLAPIRNSLHLLGGGGLDAEQAARARETIERQVVHLTRLVDDLLDVARVARGRIHLELERLDLGELVRSELEDHRVSLETAGLTVDFEPAPGPLLVDGDRTRLSQSVGNLLRNAGKFTEAGGRITVSVREEPGRRVAVAVRDTGIGLAPDLLSRLFEPFSQADRSLDRRGGGLGLGLTLVKSLIDLHGGAVEAASAGAGRGAEFTLRLPLAVASSDLPEAMPSSPEPATGARPARARRCLVIEDNEDAAESLTLLLELHGHQAALAHDGPQGLARARELRPEVVLCDIGLPGPMDGYEVARAFRADPQLAGAALIALTGYGQAEDREKAHAAGFDAHITKPADPARLLRLVAEVG